MVHGETEGKLYCKWKIVEAVKLVCMKVVLDRFFEMVCAGELLNVSREGVPCYRCSEDK